MKKFTLADFIKKTGEQVTLTPSERERMLSVMNEYIAMKPLPSAASHVADGRLSEWGRFFGTRFVAAGLVIACVVSGAGVSYAAENALPGDILYNVKVSFNEEVQGLVAVSPEAKAKWQAERAETRLEEASALATKGRLTEAIEADLSARFEKHADSALLEVSELSSGNSPAAIDVASHFETEVAAHLTILDEVSKDGAQNIKKLALKKARGISQVRTSAENGIAVSTSVAAADPASAADSMTLRSAATLSQDASINAKNASASSDEVSRKKAASRMASSARSALKDNIRLVAASVGEVDARVSASISEAKEGIGDGDRAFADADFGAAFHAYQKAFVSLKKINVILKTASKNGVTLSVPAPALPASPEPAVMDVSSVSKKASSSGGSLQIEMTQSGTGPAPTIQILPSDDSVEVHIEDSVKTDSSVEQSVRIDMHR